jgi:beta-glucanase (GH16 family)
MPDAAVTSLMPGAPEARGFRPGLRAASRGIVILHLAGCAGAPGGEGAPTTRDPGSDASAAADGDDGQGASEAEDAAAHETGASDAAAAGSFVLSWEDDFDALDLTAWQLETFTYAGNEAQFSTQNAAVANGVLTISLTANPGNTAEPYLGVEMRSAKTLTYGKVSARMRFAHGSGVVSGLVLFYTPYPNCDWNEIDIEHLGGSSNTSQLNCQVFTGTVDPQCTTSVSPTQDPLVANLGVDAETAFHQYDIEWTPAGVTTLIDGVPLRTWTRRAALMRLPQTILLTIWASSAAAWAGPLQADSAPTSADVDWIKVYSWQP